ncbi:TIGR03086 family metal-binding protein [Blastococcus litoris]|uniref:TIGR03086 family metal-binding protein n=1 Tax=Blastococcus litoris TaxID=2171622 RepID=UPI000E304926|nr:TIGR03086 family metal-binding protein [Blastococcus litoris]
MQTTTLDLGPQTAEVARIVAAVRADQLCHPTPCGELNVAALLDHLVGLTHAFREAAGKVPQPPGPYPDAARLAEDWRTRLPDQLDALAAAWREPGAWEGRAVIAGLDLPAGAVGVIALNEVLVHGWDLAAATGQEYRADPASTQACLEYAVDFAANAPEMRDQIYGPVVPVPDDAPVLHRLLGQTGRDPGWASA